MCLRGYQGTDNAAERELSCVLDSRLREDI